MVKSLPLKDLEVVNLYLGHRLRSEKVNYKVLSHLDARFSIYHPSRLP